MSRSISTLSALFLAPHIMWMAAIVVVGLGTSDRNMAVTTSYILMCIVLLSFTFLVVYYYSIFRNLGGLLSKTGGTLQSDLLLCSMGLIGSIAALYLAFSGSLANYSFGTSYIFIEECMKFAPIDATPSDLNPNHHKCHMNAAHAYAWDLTVRGALFDALEHFGISRTQITVKPLGSFLFVYTLIYKLAAYSLVIGALWSMFLVGQAATVRQDSEDRLGNYFYGAIGIFILAPLLAFLAINAYSDGGTRMAITIGILAVLFAFGGLTLIIRNFR